MRPKSIRTCREKGPADQPRGFSSQRDPSTDNARPSSVRWSLFLLIVHHRGDFSFVAIEDIRPSPLGRVAGHHVDEGWESAAGRVPDSW